MPRARLRDLGLEVGTLPPGPLNAITDVAGVKVGYATVIQDSADGSPARASLPSGRADGRSGPTTSSRGRSRSMAMAR